jgi:thioesterase domain-containing protein
MLEAFGIDAARQTGDALGYPESVEIARSPNSVLANLDAAQLDRMTEIMRENRRAVARLEHRKITVNAMVFVAKHDSTERVDPARWRQHIEGPTEAHPVDCDHLRMTAPDALRIIEPIVRRKIGSGPGRDR